MNKTLVSALTVLWGLLTLLPLNVSAEENYTFFKFNQGQGFPSRVNCFYPETDGVLWIGTPDGMYRYDGNECMRLSSLTSEMASVNDEVIDINGDSSGNVWALTAERLAVYNLASGRMHEYDIRGSETCPCRGGFVIASNRTLYRFNLETWTLETVISFNDGFSIGCLSTLPDGRILCGSSWYGIRCVDLDTRSYEIPFSLDGENINSMMCDSRGRVWLGFYNKGVCCFNLEGDLLCSYSTGNSELTNNIILSMLEKDGRIWLATDGGGICIVNPTTGQMLTMERQVGDDNSIPYESILKIISDSYGNVWALRVRGGIFVVRDQPLTTYQAVPQEKNGLTYNSVNCIYQEDGKREVWVGTDGGGVNLYSPDSREFKWYSETSGIIVTDIARFSDCEILLSSFTRGLFRLNTVTGHLFPFKVEDADLQRHLLYSGGVLNLHDEISGKVLFLSLIVYRYDPVSKSLNRLSQHHPFVSQPVAVNSHNGRTILYDSRRIYGLYPDSDVVETLYEVPDNMIIRDVSQVGNNLLWIASDRGVYSLDLSDLMFECLDPGWLISSHAISSEGSQVWIATDSSLYLWDSDTERLRNYGAMLRNAPTVFMPKASLASFDGNVYFGSMDGLVVIDGNAPKSPNTSPTIMMLDAFVDSQRQPSLTMGDKLKVGWKTKSVGVNVFSKGEDLCSRRMYMFRVNDRDTVMQDSPLFTLHNLRPGKFTVDVAGISSQGIQTSWSRVLSVTVQPPWYRSHTFILCVVLAVLAFILYWNYRYSSNLKQKMEKKLGQIKQKSEDDNFMLRLRYFIQLNLHQQEMDINLLCHELGISHSALFKRVKSITGLSIKEYIDNIRLERATEMVKRSEMSFTEIAKRTGFSNSRYFSTFFKRKTGMTPSECRLSQLTKTES